MSVPYLKLSTYGNKRNISKCSCSFFQKLDRVIELYAVVIGAEWTESIQYDIFLIEAFIIYLLFHHYFVYYFVI